MSDVHSPLAGIDGARRSLITVSIMMASIMQVLDTTIANVALPHIQGSLSATQDQIAWVLTSYIVAAAIMTPLSGWLAGQVGRKRVLLVSIAGFTLASMLCGLATSLPQMVLARLLQGLCGAALVPMSQAILLDINPPERHGRAMSIWVMGITIGPIIGPALGGWLTDNYNWRWVFYINVPFGILAFLGTLSTLPRSDTRRSAFDFFGFATLSLAVGALQITLDRGQLKDWFNSPEICIEAAVAAAAFYLFAVHMITARSTRFLNPALFKDRNFMAGCIFIFTVGVVMFATLALLPPLLQDLLNYPVVTTGIVTAPRGFGTLLAMLIFGRLSRQIDVRLVVGFGFAMTAFSAWQMTQFDLQMGMSAVVWSGITQGIGTGLVYVPLATATFATLRSSLRNEAASLFSLSRNLGSSIGISIVETLLTRNTQIVHASLAEHLTPFSPIVRAQIPGALAGHGLPALNASVTVQAAMVAYDDNFKLMMWLALAALPLVLLLRTGRSRIAAGALAASAAVE
ncbi:MAG TPA: DHA2 family efflux MFS transporter permease subunit [Steroidobacteraceae bacterium]|nr:DHA2 family efflux MFS transporter permease subunit [Steroidobacteraceae bacterium]